MGLGSSGLHCRWLGLSWVEGLSWYKRHGRLVHWRRCRRSQLCPPGDVKLPTRAQHLLIKRVLLGGVLGSWRPLLLLG